MSAFLGPIHHWMYGKIQHQEAFTSRLLDEISDKQKSSQLNEMFTRAENLPLEEVIDQSNIHGWLNQQVDCAEQRFAAVVKALLEEKNGSVTELEAIAYQVGRDHSVSSGTQITDAYQAIDSMLLDGMPCDGGRQVVSEDADELVFQYDSQLHALCRQGQEGIAAFSALREALLRGMLEDSGFSLMTLGEEIYKITREG